MSIPLYLRAREASLGPVAKAVLAHLCFAANDDGGSIFPSILTLARWTGLSERGVREALDELDQLEYIRRPPREQRCGGNYRQTVHYRVNVSALPVLSTPAPGAPLQDAHPTGAPGAATPAPGAATPAPGAPNRPYRPERPGKDKSARAKRATVKFTLPDWIPVETWDDYVEMRRRIGKPMTDKARPLAVRKLAKLRDAGHPPQTVLEESILNSWAGVFPLKENGSGRQNRGPQRLADNLAVHAEYEASLVAR